MKAREIQPGDKFEGPGGYVVREVVRTRPTTVAVVRHDDFSTSRREWADPYAEVPLVRPGS